MKCWQKNSKKTNKITVISNRKNSDLKGSGHCFSVKIKFVLVIFSVYAIIINCYGVWRSLVARTAGGREVAGSNPVTPIPWQGHGSLKTKGFRLKVKNGHSILECPFFKKYCIRQFKNIFANKENSL